MYEGLTQETLQRIGKLQKDATTTGISTATGLLWYNLEPLARRLYPVWFPLLNSVPRKKTDRPGNAIHWKAITNVSIGDPGTSEGNRNALMTFTEKDYLATYKYLGGESSVTFPAQYGSQGFDDAIGIANVNRLFGLMNQEERVLLFGNSGTATGDNGFQLGTASAPTISTTTGGTITQADFTVYIVALTGWGTSANPITVGSGKGLLTSATRTNADGSTDTIYGGISAISAASNLVAPTAQAVKVVCTPIKGAVAYAAYVSTSATPTTANAFFLGIYPSSTFTITSLPTISSNQAANAAGLSTDNSANPLHFDGLMTWGFTGGYSQDLAGSNLTADGSGGIVEFETVLQYLWDNFKLSPDAISVGGSKLINSIRTKILAGGSTDALRIFQNFNTAGEVVGGGLVRGYRVQYTGGPAKVIPLELHPWQPEGTIFFDIRQNPYPESNVAAPREMDVMADHFSIYWPLQSLNWQVGTYVFETLKHYVAFGSAVLTSVGEG
ncbi:MAG TPA: hypothetical protein VJW77_02325 [Terriglobia bacterium]|nr:hypothetical protein [Terriglobia bacterium]